MGCEMTDLESSGPLQPRSSQFLRGKTVRIYGPLQSMSIREATKLIREHGGQVLPSPSHEEIETENIPADWIIIGERQQVFTDVSAKEVPEWLSDQLREDIECGLTHIATETQLLQRLFPGDEREKDLTALYTPVMLAELLRVTVSDVRRWYQRGLIAPVRVIKRLPYFDLEEVFSARRLSLLLQNGVKTPSIEKKLKALRHLNPGVLPLLASNDLVIQGKNVFLRQNDQLLESSGQLLLDFDTIENEREMATLTTPGAELPQNLESLPGRVEDYTRLDSSAILNTLEALFLDVAEIEENEVENIEKPEVSKMSSETAWQNVSQHFETIFDTDVLENSTSESAESTNRISIAQIRASALALDEAYRLEEAAEMWRNALFVAGANAEDAFQLGDVLYRMGNLHGARERFSMAIELDEDFVEARASLGCVLGELGETQLAIHALEGAIAYHSDYAEAYYHLARFLELDGQKAVARRCYQKFLTLTEACDSFWRQEAVARIEELATTSTTDENLSENTD